MITRYFTDGVAIWKFPSKGRPMTRYTNESKWRPSAFSCLATFKLSPGKVREVTQDEQFRI